MSSYPERVLCVDDESNILEAMRRTMSSHFQLVTALGGEDGMARLRDDGPFAVVVSDLRMPVVDGISLLRFASEVSPATVRLMLTGNADIENAILAVNEGHVFRFLTKPCPASTLRTAIVAAIEQHRLVTAERVLLEQTLRGSIRSLVEMVSLVHPAVGAQTSRVRRVVVQLAEALAAPDVWRIEIAALLSHLGSVTLPAATVEKVHLGRELLTQEQSLLAHAPEVAARVIANIPRMESVQSALMYQGVRWDGGNSPVPGVREAQIPLASRLIRIATDLDLLESRGMPRRRAISVLEGRDGWYDPEALAALAQLARAEEAAQVEVVAVHALRPGMVFAEDFADAQGSLLVAHGAEVTPALMDRIRDYWDETLRGRAVRVHPAPQEPLDKAA